MQQPLDYGATPKALAQNLELVLSSEHLKVFPSSIPEFRLVMERDQFFFGAGQSFKEALGTLRHSRLKVTHDRIHHPRDWS